MVIGFLMIGGIALAICIEYPIMWIPTLIGGWWLYQKYKDEKAENERRRCEQENYNATLTKAKAGDSVAKFDYGDIVLQGRGVKADETIAMNWIRSAAAMNEPRALFKIGEAYSGGKFGFPIDKTLAMEYFEKAARFGHEQATPHVESLRRQLEKLRVEEIERKVLNASEREWQEFKRFFEKCDSEPEILLLKALIRSADLKPNGDVLRGKAEVIPQARVLKFRVDFLVNGKLVVEVDGKRYHSDSNTFASDRLRDQELILNGYQPIRFPASQIYSSAAAAASTVLKAADA